MTDGTQPTRPAAAVFLDRDGVINELVWDEDDDRYESPLRAEDVELMPGAVDAIARLQAAGLELVVVSNQPAAAKGKTTLGELRAVHERVVGLLADGGTTVDNWRYCFHHPDAELAELRVICRCRKPQPGMLIDSAQEKGIDLQRSWIVGDSDADVGAGSAAGCKTVLVEHKRSEHRREGSVDPDARVPDVAAAASLIISIAQPPDSVGLDD